MATKSIIYIDNFLVEHGYTPTIGYTITQLLTSKGVHVIKASNIKFKPLRLLHMLYVVIKNKHKGFVCISTYSGSAFYFAYIIAKVCKLLNIDYYTYLHGGNLPYRVKKSPGLSDFLFGNAKSNLAVSGYLEALMQQHGWRVDLFPNPIQINKYQFLQRKKFSGKILWVRSFHKIYNPLLIVKVVHELLTQIPHIHLTMVGPDKDGTINEVLHYIKVNNLESHISLTGYLTQEQWSNMAIGTDVFVNTSSFDNLPVSVIEALALGLPVITTNVGGMPYLIKDMYNGILINNKKDELVNALLRLYHQEQIFCTMSKNARLTAESFDWNNIYPKWDDLIKK